MTKRRTASLFTSQPQAIDRQQRRLSKQQSKLQKDIENVQQIPVRTSRNQINLNSLKRLEPLTDTQADVFDAFADPDNMAFVLYGSAGTGKCQGEDVEVNLLVSDELYEILSKMN